MTDEPLDAESPRSTVGPPQLHAGPPSASVPASGYVAVAVDLPVPGTFTYRLPPELADTPIGTRLLIEFGGRATVGLLVRSAPPPPEGADVKTVRAALDEEPLVNADLLELCLWISDYYAAPPGEVIRAALPPGTRIGAQLFIEPTRRGRAAMEGEGGALPRRQRDLLAAVGDGALRSSLTRKARAAEIDALVDAGLARVRAETEPPRVRERTERIARLIAEPDQLDLGRAPARRAIVAAIAEAGGELSASVLREDHKNVAAQLRRLEADGVIETELRPIYRVAPAGGGMSAMKLPPPLNDDQQRALAAITGALGAGELRGFLLHGITGSGKTEVYLHAIGEATRRGRSAIVLVPEISLTPQLAARFRARFGDRVAVLHSGLSARERFDEWQRLRRGEADIALGARSAVFAPLARPLGIIVVDEEHDSSFKQEEGVRYNARDVALVRAKRAGAVCVLGSATPSLESYYGTEIGRLERLELPARATSGELPAVELVDLREFVADSDSMMTTPLATAVAETLAAGDQVILFLNRRGWSTFVLCTACGEASRCRNCAVSLTYHRFRERLLCHYCNHSEPLPGRCGSCGAEAIARRGLGTEKATDAIARQFPEARIGRLDRDVAGGAGAEAVLGRFARRELDILVGTQMVTKGHDFPGVTLVGVLCADTGLSMPDFRAGERTFQLLSQVAGRAGRGDRPGRVLIQSYRTEHMAVRAARDHDYQTFYRAELASRAELGYPPHGHLIAIRLDGPDSSAVQRRARQLATAARPAATRLGVAILGPTEAPLARLKGRTRWHMWLRAPSRRALRSLLGAVGGELASRVERVRVTVDVDPVSAL